MIKSDIVLLPKNNQASGMVMFLHGVGSNAEDLISLSDYFPNKEEIIFISPNAPQNFDMAPVGYQWFSLQDRSKKAMYEGLKQASTILSEYIKKKLLEHNLGYDKLIVIGFSQGAMLAMHYFPKMDKEVAGVVAISGALVDIGTFAEEVKSRPEMLIMHGNLDEIVPFGEFANAVDKFEKNGFKVNDFVMHNTGHSINQSGILEMLSFCQRKLFFNQET